MSYETHPQYLFLKEAGLTHDQIVESITENLGLRHRSKDREMRIQAPALKPKTLKPQRPQKALQRGIPANYEDFKGDYCAFMETAKEKSHNQWRTINLPLLYSLFVKVHAKNGVVETLSIGQWANVEQELIKDQPQLFSEYSEKQQFVLLPVYLMHLLEYEFSIAGQPLNITQNINLEKSLTQAVFIEGRLAEIVSSPSRGLEILKDEIVVFPRGIEELGISYDNINLAKIESECGEEILQIRIQHPLDYGFNINKLTNIVFKMTIKDYCEYQKNHMAESYKRGKFGDQLRNGKVFFGVNFEPSNLDIFNDIWEKLENNFLGYRQPHDLLSYLDTDIPGCSSPQFYLKVKGCWTGGHQENLSMCAVNINHGPDASEWYTIPYCEVENVRQVLNEKFKCDLYRDEGLWYQKINWFIENGYPIKRILQRKGDIVVSGPGTLHWVRSYGVALQSAWNIFPKNYNMIKCALHRYQQNLSLRLVDKMSIIPIKSLLLKLLEHELPQLDDNILEIVLVTLEQWMAQEELRRLQLSDYCGLGMENALEYKLGDLESVCEVCKLEVMNYFVESWTGQGIVCLQCLADNPKVHRTAGMKLYFKYNNFQLKNLFALAKDRTKRQTILQRRLCDGMHIGRVECPQMSRKRPRSMSGEGQLTMDCHAEDDHNPLLHQIIEASCLGPENNEQTLSEMAAANKITLPLIVKSKDVDIQTDDPSCPDCGNKIQFNRSYDFKNPTKKHCSNKAKEEVYSISKLSEENQIKERDREAKPEREREREAKPEREREREAKPERERESHHQQRQRRETRGEDHRQRRHDRPDRLRKEGEEKQSNTRSYDNQRERPSRQSSRNNGGSGYGQQNNDRRERNSNDRNTRVDRHDRKSPRGIGEQEEPRQEKRTNNSHKARSDSVQSY